MKLTKKQQTSSIHFKMLEKQRQDEYYGLFGKPYFSSCMSFQTNSLLQSFLSFKVKIEKKRVIGNSASLLFLDIRFADSFYFKMKQKGCILYSDKKLTRKF